MHLLLILNLFGKRGNHFTGFRIGRPAGLALSAAAAIERERNAAGAHPAARPAWVSIYQRIIGDVTGDHRPGADECILPDRRSAYHSRVSAERSAPADQR